jgi:hypothetical protein
VEQIGVGEFEARRGLREAVEEEVRGSQAYRQYQREKIRFERAEK